MIFLFTWVIFQFHVHLQGCTPPKTNMTMENPLFEDVFPIENRYFLLKIGILFIFRGVSAISLDMFGP